MLSDPVSTLPGVPRKGFIVGDAAADRSGEMSATTLRPVAPTRFRRASTRQSVETIFERIGELTAERQRLRDRAAGPNVLERNRLRIARAQWELSHALIERHLPVAQRAA